MTIISINDLCDIPEGAATAGKTGSYRVQGKTTDKSYQLKNSILTSNLTRRLKVGSTDVENLGEFIAAKVMNQLLDGNDFKASPDVVLVSDEANLGIKVASKYLDNATNNLEEDYIKNGKGRVKFITSEPRQGTNEVNINSEDNSIMLRKDLARGLAASIMIGDHDINPGNFMVVKDTSNNKRFVRIDFGKAFNYLLNAPKFLGGKTRNQHNQVLDYFNRENVAGIKLGSPNKLFRFYPGMIPTKEMAHALLEMSETPQGKITSGLKEAKNDLGSLQKNAHSQKSLAAVAKNINKAPDRTLDQKATLEHTINAIGNFIDTNRQQMAVVGKIMDLQVKIDNLLKNNSIEDKALQEIQKEYDGLKQTDGIKHKQGITWIKTSSNNKAHKGDLQSYIKQRAAQLDKEENKGQSKETKNVIKNHAQTICGRVTKENHLSFSQKLFNRLFLVKKKNIPKPQSAAYEKQSCNTLQIVNNLSQEVKDVGRKLKKEIASASAIDKPIIVKAIIVKVVKDIFIRE